MTLAGVMGFLIFTWAQTIVEKHHALDEDFQALKWPHEQFEARVYRLRPTSYSFGYIVMMESGYDIVNLVFINYIKERNIVSR